MAQNKSNLFQEKVVFITGSSRGIGRAITLKMASLGANVVIAAKTTEPPAKLEGTIYSVADEARAFGVQALPLQMDIRDDSQIQQAIQQTIDRLGQIDILINNASAIDLSPTSTIDIKKLDLLIDINIRGTFLMSKLCLPYLKNAENPHILTLSPPLNLKPQWFGAHCAYSLSKYGMSLCVMGMAEEFKKFGIAVNALWPITTIATAAVNMIGGEKLMSVSRKPEIVADAAAVIVSQSSRNCTGNFFIDELVLREQGITDFDHYAMQPGGPLWKDLFVE